VSVGYRSSGWGVVAGNTVWAAKAITVKASSTGAASTDRYVVQVYTAGAWVNAPTKVLSRTSASVSVSFYPRWGTKAYRLALLRPSGYLRAKSATWKSQGFRTVPLQRVVTSAVALSDRSVSGLGITVPALWTATSGVQRGVQSATVGSGLCRKYLAIADITTSGAPDGDGVAGVEAGYEKEPLMWVLNSPVARAASDPQGPTLPRANRFSPVFPSEVYFTWTVNGTSGPFASAGWSGGTAAVGGAGLCVKVLR